MFYGQFNPPVDKTISEYFDENHIGGCIEIGAVDGIELSNTKYFEDRGWYCLCIEPIPNYYNQLKNNRKNALNYAISNYNKNNDDFEIIDIGITQSAVSSLKIDDKLKNQHENLIINTLKIKVNTRTLDYCLENSYKYNKIDFVSIDTEGTELDVLKGFDINKWSPELIIIENNWNDSEIENYLKDFGYTKDKRIEVNDFYIKKLFDIKLDVDINKLFIKPLSSRYDFIKLEIRNKDYILIYRTENPIDKNLNYWYSPNNKFIKYEFVYLLLYDKDNILIKKEKLSMDVRKTSYSEFETDITIKKDYFENINNGIMVELGAGAPEYYSISKYFRNNGWKCICIEPNPKFVEQHKIIGNEIYQYACSDEDKNGKFKIINTIHYLKQNDKVNGLSYSAIDIKYIDLLSKEEIKDIIEIDVEIRKLDTILDEINIDKIDFLSIDTEGWELEVMNGFNTNKFKPKVILLENLLHLPTYEEYMKSIGYVLDKKIHYNYIFIKNENLYK